MTAEKERPVVPGREERAEDRNAVTPDYKKPLAGRSRSSLIAEGSDVGGWEAYRRWLTRVQVPGVSRSKMDPALYTWKGYRSWAEKVRRDWSQDE